MNKWLVLSLAIHLFTCAECQEPGGGVDPSTRKRADELFKAETTETTDTDINRTLAPTEIDNSTSTATATETAATTTNMESGEWTTMPAENEYSISIKDVFAQGVGMVKDEMKGIGIIQSWLKEKANEAATTEDYDYTQAADDYTDANEVYDYDKTDSAEKLNINEVEKETELDNSLGTTEEIITEKAKIDILKKIEEDVEKLNRVQSQEDNELKEREELITDIEENLNKLEGNFENAQNIDKEVTTDVVTEVTTLLPEEEITEITTDYKTVTTAQEEDFNEETTTVIFVPETKSEDEVEEEVTINILDERTNVAVETVKSVEFEESEEYTTVPTAQEVTTAQETTDNMDTTTIMMPITETTTSPTSQTTPMEAVTTETTTTQLPEKSTFIAELDDNGEEFLFVTQTSVKENKDGDIILSIIPVRKVEDSTTTESSVTSMLPTTVDIVDEIVDEIIDEIKEIEGETATSTTTEDPTKIIMQETLNLTKTIDKLLKEDDRVLNVLLSNAINNHDVDSKDKDDDIILKEKNDVLTHATSTTEKNVSVDEDEIEDEDDIDAEYKFTDLEENEQHEEHEENTLGDVDQHTKLTAPSSEEDVRVPVAELEPKVSALITDRRSGDVCLNASGLSIKITANNLTDWVPSTAKVSGECTSFGAYLNITWNVESAKSTKTPANSTLSFTFIGDDEESYIEEVIFKTNKGNLIATQLERYFTEPTIIQLAKDATIIITHMEVKLTNKKKDDYATISLLNVDNALALQIASGGLCLFIVLIGVSIYSYRRLRSQARIFKVSLDK